MQVALVLILSLDVYRNGLALYRFYTHPNLRNGPPWQSLSWIREHVPPDALVMSNIAPAIDLYTQRPSTNGIYSDNFEWLDYRLMTEHTDFLVLARGGFP